MQEQDIENLISYGTCIENPKTARILIVDDQEPNIRLLERILADASYENLHATADARQVLRLCEEIQPDLILLDLHMPFLSGFEVMKQIRESLKPQSYLPILVLTADIAPDTKRAALRAGALDFLNKPFDPVEVTLRANNLLTTRFLHLRLQAHAQLLAEKLCSTNDVLARYLNELRSKNERLVSDLGAAREALAVQLHQRGSLET
jgi:two-component system sensor histidine kinase/response regulator